MTPTTDWSNGQPVTRQRVLAAMASHGGSFVQALAAAWRLADPMNDAKLRAAFPHYWSQYEAVARQITARREDRGPGVNA